MEDKHKAFNTILENDALRFHHMDMDYLAVYAFRTPWMQTFNQRTVDIMHRAMLLRIGCKWKEGIEIPTNRSHEDKTCYDLEAKVPKDVCTALQDNQTTSCFIGVIKGLPIYLSIHKKLSDGDDEKTTMGIYVGWSSAGLPMSGEQSQEVTPSVTMALDLKAEPDVMFSTRSKNDFQEDIAVGWHSLLGPWESVLDPTSGRFVDDVMTFHVQLREISWI